METELKVYPYYVTFNFDSLFLRKRYIKVITNTNIPDYELRVLLKKDFPNIAEVYSRDRWYDANYESLADKYNLSLLGEICNIDSILEKLRSWIWESNVLVMGPFEFPK